MEIINGIMAILAYLMLYALILAVPVMLLWNYVMPDIFGLSEINFWQALSLNLLSGFLFRFSTGTTKKGE